MSLDKTRFTELIQKFKFKELFNELGWDHAEAEVQIAIENEKYNLTAVAEKRGFVIFICSPSTNGKIPLYNSRKKIDLKITKLYFEHLIIYTDKDNFQQIWQLVIREADKPVLVRETPYFQTQHPELLFQRLRGIFISLDDEEKITIADVRSHVREQFNTNAEKVTKKFYQDFKNQHTAFLKFIEGIENIVDRDWYASLMLNRLMFIYFIQKKGFLDDNINYLNDKLKETQKKKGKDKFYSFYRDFLLVLFHKGLGAPERDDKLIKEIGKIPYLNGGLFDVHQIESKYKNIEISDNAFHKIFNFFDDYNWHLDTRVASSGKDINPDVIGYIFEKYINDRASMGAYYTKEDITEYISKNTIIPFLFDEVKKDCSIAFKDESSIWKMLKDNPDKYIYDSIRYGVYKEGSNNEILELPEEIAIGLDTTKSNLLERRKEWNKQAPSEYALPTEIWREVVERRNRYFEIKNKIEKDEIRDINDFITYNLNIRQFVQDAVEQYEGSDFVNAFYKAIKKITILDPTCGSGAFLFAALNILEPLYESLLHRIKVFIEEDDQNSGRKFSQFRQMLKEIENHPNEKYYIYKSIILNNLYGVDIMNEAVEIAKLRLFLKLVAEVEDFNHLEPLPDIDFNIRSGNTLIGFATKEELENGLTWSLNLDVDKPKIYEEMDIVAKTFKRYKEIQLDDRANHSNFKQAKDELLKRLKKLNDSLNDYLGNDYGKFRKKKKEFAEWLNSYKPFHWFAEFYEIIESGGFDVIIGNPPYVSLNKIDYELKNYETISANNLYNLVQERSVIITKLSGHNGVIVMLNIKFSSDYEIVRNFIYKNCNNIYVSSFDNIPDGLFSSSGKEESKNTNKVVSQRVSILLYEKYKRDSQINLTFTKFYRWNKEFRHCLFSILEYSVHNSENNTLWPSLGSIKAFNIYNKIQLFSKIKLYSLTSDYGNYTLNLGATPRYFISAVPFDLNRSGIVKLKFNNKAFQSMAESILNSNLFYWYWRITGDGFHLTKGNIFDFPISNKIKETSDVFTKFSIILKDKKDICTTSKLNNGIKVFNVNYNKIPLVINQIDSKLAEYYGFTEEELDFIINYDIKYRMGKELVEEA